MRITFLMSGLGCTGGSLAIYKHAENLTRLGHAVYITLPGSNFKWNEGMYHSITKNLYGKSTKKNIISLGKYFLKTIDSRIFRDCLLSLYNCRRNDLRYITEQLIKNWVEADITFATFWNTATAGALLSGRSTVLYYMQHYEEVFFRKSDKRRILCRMTYGLPINLISNSEWLQKQIEVRFGRSSYRINHAITNPDLFEVNNLEVNNKFKNIDSIKIISYCDLRPFKGWNYSVEAMRIVKKRYPGVIWRTFGNKLDTAGVQVEHLGRLSDEDLAQAYKDSHIGFMASLYESFPLQPLEMMASGCATVTTPFGTEPYTEDGRNCLIAEPKNAEDIARKIIRLIEDQEFAKHIAQNGIETSKKFTWEKSTNQLLKIISDAQNNNKFADLDNFLPED